ncbi:hypothetical protein Q4543_15020 [Salipiger sp. 1_MG-2023]|uniref:hypothetical protein n=1 Tax=Salipiger sp. 1_MG-2023 TaxID=3062665 RepID=UPI0026E2F2DB|nr:hypothetical protein [Salipiger sp. 1_MG-2023]MDO6586823.1 hypothetical protein [Salipiger sp. 1_MG-2023]
MNAPAQQIAAGALISAEQRATFRKFADHIAAAEAQIGIPLPQKIAADIADMAPRHGISITITATHARLRAANIGVGAGTLPDLLSAWRARYQETQP